MRLVAVATPAVLILNGCGAAAGGSGGYRQGMPAACYALKPDPRCKPRALPDRPASHMCLRRRPPQSRRV